MFKFIKVRWRRSFRPPSDKYKLFDRASEDDHRIAEEFSWKSQNRLSFLTIILAFLTTGLSSFTLWFAFSQTRAAWHAVRDGETAISVAQLGANASRDQANSAAAQTNIAKQNLIITTRSWMAIRFGTDKMSMLSEGDIPELRVPITATNFGPTPALQINSYGEIIPATSFDKDAEVEKVCRFANHREEKIDFPREEVSLNRLDDDRADFLGDPQLFDPNEMANTGPQSFEHLIHKQPVYRFLTFVFCLTYKVSGDSAVHMTAVIRDLQRASDPDAPNRFTGKLDISQSIPEGALRFDPDDQSNYLN